MKLQGRLLLLLLVVSLARACFNKTNLNKKEGEYEFEVKRENNSAPAINAGSQGSVLDDASVDECSRTWFVWKNGTCTFGEGLDGIVKIESNEVMILDCYSMTTDTTGNKTVVGQCFFNCANLTNSKLDLIYHRVAKYVIDLNETCSYLHRTGTLCGECMRDYVPTAYSYSMECIKCSHTHHNWLKYVAVAFLPLTVFMIFVLVFRVSVSSPKLLALVFAFQNFSAPVNMRILVASEQYFTAVGKFAFQTMSVLYGVWNLDFFRTILNRVCLNVSTLQVLALDYLVAVYPMLVMAIAYVLVELHGYGFRPVLYVWRPFHYFFARFRRQWDIQHSIMDAFVTFFILSTTKFLSVSFDLLIPTMLYTPDGTPIGLYLYYDANVRYFHGHHLPYALLALTVLTVFIVLPLTLLTFYPCRLFQKCLMKCKLHNTTLISFVHMFQQYYRDGRNGTMDCRLFAGFYFVVRICTFLIYALTLNDISYLCLACFAILLAIFLLVVQPYKKEYEFFNTGDVLIILLQAIFMASVAFWSMAMMKDKRSISGARVIVGMSCYIPFLCLLIIIIHRIYKNKLLSAHHEILCPPCHRYISEDIIPDRVSHPNDYLDSFGYVRATTDTG